MGKFFDKPKTLKASINATYSGDIVGDLRNAIKARLSNDDSGSSSVAKLLTKDSFSIDIVDKVDIKDEN